MAASTIMDALPLWAIFLLTASVVLLSIEAGWRLGDQRRRKNQDENKAPVGAAVGATLGLLAFLLAFTFGLAANRFDNRKQVVLQEANAVGTTYLRVDFLPAELQPEARRLLREYASLRAGGANALMSAEGLAKTSLQHDQLWAIAARATQLSDTISTGLFVQSLNEMIDLDEVRLTAARNRIPDPIWFMLATVTVFSMVAMGYQFGLSGSRSWGATIFLVLVFTPVILLIADLDRSQSGLLRVSQQPLIDLLNKIGPGTH